MKASLTDEWPLSVGLFMLSMLSIMMSCTDDGEMRLMEDAERLVVQSIPVLDSLRKKYPMGRDWYSYWTNDSYQLVYNSEYGIRDRFVLSIQVHLNREQLKNRGIVYVKKIDLFLMTVASVRVLDDGRISVRYSQGQKSERLQIDNMDSDQMKKLLNSTVENLIETIPDNSIPVPDFHRVFQE